MTNRLVIRKASHSGILSAKRKKKYGIGPAYGFSVVAFGGAYHQFREISVAWFETLEAAQHAYPTAVLDLNKGGLK